MSSSPLPALVVIMGVAGSGKTTVGRIVARTLDVSFLDGDDYHSAENIASMRHGRPLDDADRVPWRSRLHAELLVRQDSGAVLACSALRRSFRDQLREGLPQLQFMLLDVPPAELQRRLDRRKGHFVGSNLLVSQLDSLEVEGDLTSVNGDRPPAQVATDVVTLVRATRSRTTS